MKFDPTRNPETKDLPIIPYLPEITRTLEKNRTLVLTAEPGAGKSTVVPLALLFTPAFSSKKIIMLEPRRLAAVSIAARTAELLGEDVGELTGYRVRLESKTGRRTRLEVVTEALLTRMILSDPDLAEIGVVIFDEFHERSVHADTAFALAREVKELKPDLALLVMSATMDAEKVSRALGNAPVIACPGRMHPVDVRYRPLSREYGFEEKFASELSEIAAEEKGNILAFLPGTREIRKTAEKLERLAPDIEILPLHGLLSLSDQKRVLSPGSGGRRRIILSTSIAETSLTVPDIRIVADSGLARFTRFHRRTGMDRLVTEDVSLQQADQRKGRAGRTGPGIIYRFWDPSRALRKETEPEILRSDLAGTVLVSLYWGVSKPGDLPWLDAPPESAWEAASVLLRKLGAADGYGRITELGKRILETGLSPRAGAIVLAGYGPGRERLAAACAALLEIRDETGFRDEADLRLRLEALRTGTASRPFVRKIETECRHILFSVSGTASAGRTNLTYPFSWTAEQEADAGFILLSGFPDRAAMNTGNGIFRFPSGRQATIRGSLSGEKWIVAPDADAGEITGTIYSAAPVTAETVETVLAESITEDETVEWKGWKAQSSRVRRLESIVLGEVRSSSLSRKSLESACLRRLREEGLLALPWDERALQALARLRFAAHNLNISDFPDFSDESLLAEAETWCIPFLGTPPGPVLDSAVLLQALESRLAGGQRALLDREAPHALSLPSGRKVRLVYNETEAPALEVRIQEVFGMKENPRVCGRPVVLHLLSPAMRPLQITSDLAGFWENAWREVRKEMRGRYPRHRWPEDPGNAEPGAVTKRRLPE